MFFGFGRSGAACALRLYADGCDQPINQRALFDRFGRKKILLSGLVIFIIGGIGALLSTTIDMLMLAGDLTGLLKPFLLSFLCFCFGVCNGLVIALGGADHFSVTATGLLIISLCAVLSSFLAPNSR